MATRQVSLKIALDGEKQYKQALSEINSGMKVLRSEMTLTAETFADNADSQEALIKKGDILERQILAQKDKVATLEAALQNAASAWGESDKRTMEWQTSLNKAEAELVRMNRELADNQEALKKTSEAEERAAEATDTVGNKFSLFSGESKGLGDVLDKVGDKFGIKLPGEMQSTLNGIAKINPATVAAAGGFAALIVAIEKAEAKLKEMTIESAAYADEMLTLANNTGMSTEALQEWAYAEELIDVSSETVRSSMAKMIRVMGDAKDGSKDASAKFSELGVSIMDTNGNLRDAESVFYDVVDALGQVDNSTERDAKTMDIFGKSAMDLNSLIVQGSDTLREYAAEAHEMGYVLSNEDLDALGAVDDAQQRLLKTQEAVSNQISAEYAPYMEKALTMNRDLWQEVGEALTDSGVVESLGSILVSTTSLLKPLVELGKDILPVVGTGLQAIAGFMALIADAADIVAGILTWDWDRVGVALGFGTSSGRTSHTQRVFGLGAAGADASGSYFNPETGMYEGNYYHNASGTDYFPGGMTRVGENGPETVFLPTGTVIANAQETRGSGGDTVYIVVHVDHIDDLEDLIRIKNSARRMGRMKGAMA